MSKVGMLSFITGFVFLAACLGEPSVKSNNAIVGSELVRVKNGRPTATIVISDSPTDNARSGANELQRYIEKISGAKLPIASDSTPPSGCMVLVGRSKLTDEIAGLDIPSGRSEEH